MRKWLALLLLSIGIIHFCKGQTGQKANSIIDQIIERSEQALFNADFDEAIRLVSSSGQDNFNGIEPRHKILLTIQSIRVQGIANIVRMQRTAQDQNYNLLAPYLFYVKQHRNKELKAKFYQAFSSAQRSIGNADSAAIYEERSREYFRKAKRKDQLAQIRANQISRRHNRWLAEGKKNEILGLIPLYQNEIKYASKHSKYALAYNTRHLGQIYRRQTINYKEALKWFQKSLELREEIAFKPFIPASISSLGDVYTKMEEYELAIEAYLKSVELAKEIGFVRYESYPLQTIGDIYLIQGDKMKAREFFEKARDIAKGNGFASGEDEASKRLQELGS